MQQLDEFKLEPLTESFNLKTCTRCELCKSRRNVVSPRIKPGSKILFVCDAPSPEDDMSGSEPLVGQSGQLLKKYLMQVGINYDMCSAVNVVQCRTPDGRAPEKNEIAACYDIVDLVINIVKPEIIVPLGNTAMSRIAKTSGILKKNGLVLTHDNYPGVKIIPVVDPKFVLRDQKNESFMIQGLSRVKTALSGEKLDKISAVTYVDTIDKFNSMIADLRSGKYFAIDIETDVLRDWKTGNIICISFSNKKGFSYVLPWNIGDAKFYATCRQLAENSKRRGIISNITRFCSDFGLTPPTFFWKDHPEVKEKLKLLFADTNYAKILHNYMFDYKFLESAGLKIEGQIYDTMILHYLLNETRGTHGLDACCLSFTDYGEYWKGLEKYINHNQDEGSDSYGIIPIEELIPYAGTDADVTIQIFEIFLPKIQAEGFETLYNGYKFPLSLLLMETEKNGMAVDQVYLENCEKILKENIAGIDYKLNEFVKDITYDPEKPEEKGINFNSVPQLKFLLYDYLRLPVLARTEKGAPSTDADVLEQLANLSEVPKLLLDRRKKTKLLSTYFTGMRAFIWSDGKVHPNFLLTGTETGRLAARGPNVQNLTRNPEEPTYEEKEVIENGAKVIKKVLVTEGSELFTMGIKVRDLFISSDPENYYIVETDYSQAELRLVAEFSRDRNLYNAFMEGRDPHAELAVRIYHKEQVPLMEAKEIDIMKLITKEERQNAKTANFSLLYGKAAKNFAVENNIPMEEAYHIHKVYWDTYPGITSWKDRELLKARNNGGEFVTLFGRKRRIKKIFSNDEYFKAEAEREGINSLIQAQASDYTLWSTMIVVREGRKLGLDFKPISFVHDSAVFEVRKTDIQKFLTLLKEVMLHPPGISIPMESEVKVGIRLGSLSKWECYNGVWEKKRKK